MAVAVSCNGITITDQCSVNLTEGRGNLDSPASFSIHCVPFSAEEYLSMQQQGFGGGEFVFTEYPKSVNYFIASSGFVWELVPPNDRSWAFTEFYMESWGLLDMHDTTNPNDIFISIGFEGDELNNVQLAILTNLICCLSIELGIPIIVNGIPNIVFPTQIDTRLTCPSCLPETLVNDVTCCIEEGGQTSGSTELLDPTTCCRELREWREDFVDPTICTLVDTVNSHTSIINDLLKRVAQLEMTLSDVQPLLQGLQDTIDAMQEQITDNTKKLALHQICIEELCAIPEIQCIHYQLLPNDAITVTPGTNRRLTLPTKITDTEPPTAIGSSLQSFCLNQPCTYNIQGVARFAFGAWCQDRIARLILIACSQEIILDEFVVPADGNYTVTLEGSTTLVVPPACVDTHLAVFTDDVTTPSKVIEFADVQFCCSGMSCPPSNLTSLLPPIGKT